MQDENLSVVEFFKKILPPSGILCIATGRLGSDRKIRHWTHETHKGQDAFLAGVAGKILGDNGREIYFALGSLQSETIKLKNPSTGEYKEHVRVKKNIKELKCFFSDLDVDETKPDTHYSSWQSAVLDLKNFCKTYKFPKPIIVKSGRGLHIYWPLEHAISKDEWELIAKKFEAVLLAATIKIDTSRQSDCASILRVPNTLNRKHDKTVEIFMNADEIPNDAFIQSVDRLAKQFQIKVAPPRNQALSLDIPGERPDMTNLPNDVISEYPDSDFNKLLRHCPQMQAALITGCDGEPLWKSLLGVCAFTTDPEGAAVAMSERHPEYNKSAMLEKLNNRSGLTGATHCETIDKVNPGICENCEHFGSITSPIVLGYEHTVLKAKTSTTIEDTDDDDGFDIPSKSIFGIDFIKENMPEGFFISENGGIARESPDKDKGKLPILISKEVFYPVKVILDEKSKTLSTSWIVESSTIESKEFDVPNKTLATPQELYGLMASKGIVAISSKRKHLDDYMNLYVQKLQRLAKPEVLLSRQGWRDDNKAFAVQNKVFRSDGTVQTFQEYGDLLTRIPGLGENGNINAWIDAIQFYNIDGHEAHRLCLYAAFGSVLYHMSGHRGVMVYLSGKSGCGKSTVQKAINSMWGHPNDMLVNGTESGMTQNAMYGILSAYNNLPLCLDEVSNLDPKTFCSLALCISQGTGKRRSTRNGELSSIIENWANIVFSSSNSDAYLTTASQKGDSTAQSMRIFQLQMQLAKTRSKAEADIFLTRHLTHHYGLAGPKFIAHVVTQYDALKEKILKSVARIDEKLHAQPAERFWVALIAAAAVAGTQARKIGLLPDFPIEKDIDWAMSQMYRARDNVTDITTTNEELVSLFLDTHIDEMLILERSVGTKPFVASLQPRSSLTIRFERDTNQVYISRKAFSDFCQLKGQNFAEVEKALRKDGLLITTDFSGFKVLGAGTEIETGQTRCILIDARKLSKNLEV